MRTDIFQDPKEIEEKRIEKEKKVREKYLNDIRKICSMPEGRRIFAKIFERCGIYRMNLATNASVYHQEGMRSVGLYFLQDLLEAKRSLREQIDSEYYSVAKQRYEEQIEEDE